MNVNENTEKRNIHDVFSPRVLLSFICDVFKWKNVSETEGTSFVFEILRPCQYVSWFLGFLYQY